MYYPTDDQIRRAGPRPGMFYWATRALNVAEIARVAAKNSETPISTANMVALIAGSTWNHHIRYSSKGYTSYGIEGPQMEAKYSATDPTAGYGTGTSWPVLWIPTADGKEPDDIYGSPEKPVLSAPPSEGGGTLLRPGTPSSGGGTTIRPGAGEGGTPGTWSSGGASDTGSGGGATRDSNGRIVTAGVGGSSSGLLLALLLLGVGAVGWMYTRSSGKKRKRKKRR